MAEPFRLANPFRRIKEVRFASFVLIVEADSVNYNVYNEFLTKYGVPPADVKLRVEVRPNVVVSATSTGTAAMAWGSAFLWPGAPTFTLINSGYVIGKGGAGGDGLASTNGSNGGKAIELSGNTVQLTNAAGRIWGGGGGGGGGCFSGFAGCDSACGDASQGGGGGAGAGTATGGASDPNQEITCPGMSSVEVNSPGAGTSGSLIEQVGGLGGSRGVISGTRPTGIPTCFPSGGPPQTVLIVAGAGGNGGNYGEAGQAGGDAFVTDSYSGPDPIDVGSGGAGGAAGKAIDLGGGSVIWLSGNTPDRVKGAVS